MISSVDVVGLLMLRCCLFNICMIISLVCVGVCISWWLLGLCGVFISDHFLLRCVCWLGVDSSLTVSFGGGCYYGS